MKPDSIKITLVTDLASYDNCSDTWRLTALTAKSLVIWDGRWESMLFRSYQYIQIDKKRKPTESKISHIWRQINCFLLFRCLWWLDLLYLMNWNRHNIDSPKFWIFSSTICRRKGRNYHYQIMWLINKAPSTLLLTKRLTTQSICSKTAIKAWRWACSGN